jgi:hypothetical protein
MSAESPWVRDPREPLAARWVQDPARPGHLRFEITSRGDRVAGRVWLPDGPGPFPLVILAGETLDEAGEGRAFVAAGLAVAAVDLPLHGARRSPKWSERLSAVLGRGVQTPGDETLFEAFLRQGAWDLQRVADAAGSLDGVEAGALVLAARGAGAWVGAAVAAADPRVAAAALAPGAGAPDRDPREALAGRPARPLLILDPQPIGGGRAEAWYAAARGPCERATLLEDTAPATWSAAVPFLQPHAG